MCTVTILLKKIVCDTTTRNRQFRINKHKEMALPKSLFCDLEVDILAAKLLYKEIINLSTRIYKKIIIKKTKSPTTVQICRLENIEHKSMKQVSYSGKYSLSASRAHPSISTTILFCSRECFLSKLFTCVGI